MDQFVIKIFECLWSGLKSLNVEPIVALSYTAILARNSAMQQLMQDKLCNFKYDMDYDFCSGLAAQPDSNVKNLILSDVTAYLSGRELVMLFPNFLITLFAASWCDRFPGARRYVIIASLIGQLLETIFLLLAAIFYNSNYILLLLTGIPSGLMGNGFVMASYSFVSANVETEKRSVRFLILDVFLNLGYVMGFVCSGRIIASRSLLFPRYGLRNYSDIFLLGIVLFTLCLVWTWFRIKQSNSSETTKLRQLPETVKEKVFLKKFARNLSLLFTLRDIRDMWQTITKKRTGKEKIFFWVLMFVYFSLMMPLVSFANVIFPLVEKVYFWDYQTYTYYMALFMALKPLVVTLYITFVVKRFQLQPLTIVLFGTLSTIFSLIAFGSITSPTGFIVENVAGLISGTAVSGIRTFISIMIPSDEITKVFCVMQIIETVLPFIGSAIVASIFKATIDFYPTLVIHSFAMLDIVSLSIICWIETSIRSTSV